MKIDIFSHIAPRKFIDALAKRIGEKNVPEFLVPRPASKSTVDGRSNIDMRLALLDKFPGLTQVLTPTGHTVEKYASPDDAAYLAKVYNDELAELVHKHPDKFVAAVASLPLNNIDATLKEIDRAINELGLRGINLNTPINGKSLDSAEFLPIYERMSNYNLPIWVHPTRHYSFPDYVNESESKYNIFQVWGWPHETTVAMTRLVCSGIMAKYPNLKIITHHAGATIPFLSGRIQLIKCPFEQSETDMEKSSQEKRTIDYFRMFYNDTAIYGNTPALMCAHAFFGTEHLLFGTDMPYGPGIGEEFTRVTIDAIEGMSISAVDKQKIFEGNAKALLRLDI
jgi:predicted TIM-barrel fold metal-dependent hydrolase